MLKISRLGFKNSILHFNEIHSLLLKIMETLIFFLLHVISDYLLQTAPT